VRAAEASQDAAVADVESVITRGVQFMSSTRVHSPEGFTHLDAVAGGASNSSAAAGPVPSSGRVVDSSTGAASSFAVPPTHPASTLSSSVAISHAHVGLVLQAAPLWARLAACHARATDLTRYLRSSAAFAGVVAATDSAGAGVGPQGGVPPGATSDASGPEGTRGDSGDAGAATGTGPGLVGRGDAHGARTRSSRDAAGGSGGGSRTVDASDMVGRILRNVRTAIAATTTTERALSEVLGQLSSYPGSGGALNGRPGPEVSSGSRGDALLSGADSSSTHDVTSTSLSGGAGHTSQSETGRYVLPPSFSSTASSPMGGGGPQASLKGRYPSATPLGSSAGRGGVLGAGPGASAGAATSGGGPPAQPESHASPWSDVAPPAAAASAATTLVLRGMDAMLAFARAVDGAERSVDVLSTFAEAWPQLRALALRIDTLRSKVRACLGAHLLRFHRPTAWVVV
jgi:hypothetical protein